MVTKKKTLYEILAVAPTASYADIEAAYTALLAALQSQKGSFTPADYDFRLKVIHLAYTTLSTAASRDAYDAKQAALQPSPAPVPTIARALALQPDPEALSLRAEAMSLRADAMSLRADAMVLKSGGPAYGPTYGTTFSPARSQDEDSLLSSFAPVLRKILLVLGTLGAITIVSQLVAMVFASHRVDVSAGTAAKASEKVQLQEYYQTHGVQPANLAEMERMEAENRRKEAEKRTAERDKSKAELDARRFEDESRRLGDRVAADLRMAELQAAEQARREDERKERQQLDEQRLKDQIERNRIERQKAEWREVLRR